MIVIIEDEDFRIKEIDSETLVFEPVCSIAKRTILNNWLAKVRGNNEKIDIIKDLKYIGDLDKGKLINCCPYSIGIETVGLMYDSYIIE